MKVQGQPCRTIWVDDINAQTVQIIDQLVLPHRYVVADLNDSDAVVRAIKDMQVRGAPLIGAAGAYGLYLGALEAAQASDPDGRLIEIASALKTTRPTAVNLAWAVDGILDQLLRIPPHERAAQALVLARGLCDDEVARCRTIGEHGVELIREISRRKHGAPVNILTHCNAGWLACVDWGTATAPIYVAQEQGIPLHVWVDETRPRNQGASLTAWELLENGVDHTVIADNTGGHLMQHGMVDLVITGADRVTACGDAANKIGTYLKALAANDNRIPFYVALPSSTFDWTLNDGVAEIPIEERDQDEVRYISGDCDGEIRRVLVTPAGSRARNYGFDVTPARLITGLITERGICKADRDDIRRLYPENAR